MQIPFILKQKVWYAGPAPRSNRRFIEEYHGRVGTVSAINGYWIDVDFEDGHTIRSHFTDFEPIWEYKEC